MSLAIAHVPHDICTRTIGSRPRVYTRSWRVVSNNVTKTCMKIAFWLNRWKQNDNMEVKGFNVTGNSQSIDVWHFRISTSSFFCPFDHAERQYSESENEKGKYLHFSMPLNSLTVTSLSVSDDGLAVQLFQILEHIYRFQIRAYAQIPPP